MINLLGRPDAMMDAVLAQMQTLHLPTDLVCDHVCYRVATMERYIELREALRAYGELASEAVVAGRVIATFALHQPYAYKGRTIPAIELPAPKPGKAYAEGWEHMEMVVAEPLAAFVARYPNLSFNTGAMHKPHNPEVALQITPQYQAKFHNMPLLDVIARENENPALLATLA